MSTRFLSLAVAMILLVALPCTAGTVTYGPFPDFAGWVEVTNNVVVPTATNFHIPWDGTITITDRINVKVTQRVAVYVPTYVKVTIVGDPEIQDPLSFFDIYAKDLDPENPGTALTGFNPTSPELVPLTSETFIGLSGTQYPAPVQAVSLSDLQSMLGADFDLSAFSQGAPSSIVYVAGPGQMPAADAITPEPATLALLALGGLGMAGRVVRRRRG